MSIRFSIITCTWNSEAFLKESIDSVLSQDYDNYEYIFVDGGSTDGTLDMIRQVPRPYKFVTGVRGGISNAMNVGIRMATGDVVAHMHSDDLYGDSRVFSRVADVFERTGCRWMFGRARFLTDGKLRDEGWKVPTYSYKRLLKGNFIPHESTFVRRDLFEEAGLFDTSLKYAMDYDMWLRLGKLAEPVQIDDHLSVFREHGGSTTVANPMLGFKEDHAIRMSHADRSIKSYLYHGAHYVVRRLRKGFAHSA